MSIENNQLEVKRYYGIYSALIMEVFDVKRQGRCLVYISDIGGSTGERESWITVRYMAPFAGATPLLELSDDGIPEGREIGQSSPATTDEQLRKEFEATQKSYGMWFPIPDVGNEVAVSFLNGMIDQGIILGGFYAHNMNHMVPGIAGGKTYRSTPETGDKEFYPTTEYNKLDEGLINRTDNPERPIYYPLYAGLRQQGLLRDYIRGTGTSSARRDVVSRSYGIATPRGTQFVMDDGFNDEDLSFGNVFDSTNATTAKGNPASSTDSRKDELIRLRTRSGAQILINEEFGMVYIISRDGNNWIEMANDGHIDIYGKDSISIHAEGDLNLRANQNINIEAGNDINMKAVGDDGAGFGDVAQVDEDGAIISEGGPNNKEINGKIKMESKSDFDITVGSLEKTPDILANLNITVKDNMHQRVEVGEQLTFAKSNIHIKTEASMLLRIGDDADGGSLEINTKTNNNMFAGGNTNIKSDGNNAFTADGNTDILSGGNHTETAARIDMNGPPAAPADTAAIADTADPSILPTINDLTTENKNEGDIKASITARTPQHEPWAGHIRSDSGEQSPKAELDESLLIATKSPNSTASDGSVVVTGASRQIPNAEIQQTIDRIKSTPQSGSLQASSTLGISPEGLDSIRKFESFLPYEYFDIKGFSLGYGHLQENGPDSAFDEGITEEEAFTLFTNDVKLRENIVKRGTSGATLTQGQFDALVSLVYNVGNLGSQLKAALREGRSSDAAEIFLRYSKSRNSAGQLEVNSALLARRQIELKIFQSGIYPTVITRKEHELLGVNRTITRWSKGFLEPKKGIKTTTRQIQQANSAVLRVTGRPLPETEASRPLALQGKIIFKIA